MTIFLPNRHGGRHALQVHAQQDIPRVPPSGHAYTPCAPVQGVRGVERWLNAAKSRGFRSDTQVAFAHQGMGRWLFDRLPAQPVGLSQPAPLVVAHLLASLAAPELSSQPADLEHLINRHGVPTDMAVMSAPSCRRLLKAVLGNDAIEFGPQADLYPGSPADSRAWAAILPGGHLWFTTGDWMQGGAFHCQLPQWPRDGLRTPVPTVSLAWDQNLRTYAELIQHNPPTLLAWPRQGHSTEPAHVNADDLGPSLLIHDLPQQIMTDHALSLVHQVQRPGKLSQEHPVRLWCRNGRQTQFNAFSSLMCQPEAWLSAMRLQALSGQRPFKAERVLSAMMVACAQHPIQRRVFGLLALNKQVKANAGAMLDFYDEGDLLRQDMQSLLGADTIYATINGLNDVDVVGRNTLRMWVTPNPLYDRAYTHTMHYQVRCPMISPEPFLMTQPVRYASGDEHDCLPGPLTLTMGQTTHFTEAAVPSVSFILDDTPNPELLSDFHDRSMLQENFWKHMLHIQADG